MAFTDKRLELHQILTEVLGSDEVHFQAPTNRRLTYPCIIYRIENGDSRFADNKAYMYSTRYQITYIDREPDSDFAVRLIKRLPKCVYDQRYEIDNLYHDVLNLYY